MPSLTPLLHLTLQSRSLVESHPAGQQPSSCTHMVWLPASTQSASQVAAAPCSVNLVQPWLGQEVGQLDGGSHCSPLSMTPFPQTGCVSGAPPSGWPPGTSDASIPCGGGSPPAGSYAPTAPGPSSGA